MSLTREQILGKVDIAIKEIEVPEWGGSVHIRQLTRGEQDTYLKRQTGESRLKQDAGATQQEISGVTIYGHDAYLCACGICDSEGSALFKQEDIKALDKKNGAVIGRIAVAIVEFSEMKKDVATAKKLGTNGHTSPEQVAAEDLKN